MPTIPYTTPPWEREASIESYGGHREKANEGGISAYDAVTQVDCTQWSSLVDHLLACLRTSPFAVLTVDLTEAPTVTAYRSMYGIGTAFAPDVTAISDGYVSVDWDASYQDSYDQVGNTNITQCSICVNDADTFSNVDITAIVTSTKQVLVRVQNPDNTDLQFTLTVY